MWDHDYEEPPLRTWHEAYKMCKMENRFLPSFVSEKNISNMKRYLKRISLGVLVTTLFIGIHRKVPEIANFVI